MKLVRVFSFDSEAMLETELNKLIMKSRSTGQKIEDISFSTTTTVDDSGEQTVTYSALVVVG